jgi:hypothetical protein
MRLGTAQPQKQFESLSLAWAVVLILLVTAAVRLPFLSLPLERDEGEYAYVAWRQGFGELPYRDWVDQKPPGIFWIYRAALCLPLAPAAAIHLAGLLWSAGSAIALWLVARRLTDPFWALLAAVLFALLSADPYLQGTAANTEIFMVLPLTLSLLAFFRAADSDPWPVAWMVLCGALSATGTVFKQVCAPNWLFLAAAFPFFTSATNRRAATLRFAAWSAAGACAVWGLIALYFAARGGLAPMVHDVLLHNLAYVQGLSAGLRWQLFLGASERLWHAQTLVWAFALAGLAALWTMGRKRWLLLVAGWILASLIGICASGYFFPHYFQQILPVLSLAAAVGGAGLCRGRFWKNAPARTRTIVLSACLIVPPALTLSFFCFRCSPEQVVRTVYPKSSFAEMPELGRRLAQATRPEDRVFVFGSEPELLFYARRVSASRYIFLNPLYGPYKQAAAEQEKTIDEILRAQPAAIVYFQRGLVFLAGSDHTLTRWTRSYLGQGFVPDSVIVANDQAGSGAVLPIANGQPPALSPDQQIVATLFLRVAH